MFSNQYVLLQFKASDHSVHVVLRQSLLLYCCSVIADNGCDILMSCTVDKNL